MFNPTRRSRKIGKTQGGRVKNGKAVEKYSRFFSNTIWERLTDEFDGEVRYLKENPSRDYYHPCNSADVEKVLRLCPKRTKEKLKAVIFRKLSKADEKFGVEARRRFGCIILNSFPKSNRISWGKKQPSKGVISHYRPWCDSWEKVDGEWYQQWTGEEVKKYYLYHLLLHELGHLNDEFFTNKNKREEFAEDFALKWARIFGQLKSEPVMGGNR